MTLKITSLKDVMSDSKVIAREEDMKCKVVKLYIQFKFIFIRKGIRKLFDTKIFKTNYRIQLLCISNSLFIQLKYVPGCIK